jgi:tetratricopeptide (TPR) repeat protein
MVRAIKNSNEAGERRRWRRRGRSAIALSAVVLVGVLVGGFAGTLLGTVREPASASSAPADPGRARSTSTIEQLEAAVEERPDSVEAVQTLGAAYIDRAAATGDPAFYARAEKSLDRADELAPDDPVTLIARGALALARHEFDEALDLGQRAVELMPASADALGVVVDAEVELGQYDQAAEHAQQMLDLRPGMAALARASYLRELTGDLAGAQMLMSRAERAADGVGTQRATVAALLGDLQLRLGEYDAAYESYQRAKRDAPDLAIAGMGLARLHAAQGDVDAAVTALDDLLTRSPVPAAAVLLGELHEQRGDQKAARDAYALAEAMTALQREQGQVVDLELALFEADHGDANRAVDLARAAHAARPDNVYASDALAWALLRAGQPGAALEHAEHAVRLDTADGLLRYHAAEVFAAAERDDPDREALTAALEQPSALVTHRDAVEQLAGELGVALPAGWAQS